MIAYLKGKVIDSFDGGVVLENNGIGYEVLCSSSAFSRLLEKGEGGVFTYFQVKEDGVALFGFDTKEEKTMFLTPCLLIAKVSCKKPSILFS